MAIENFDDLGAPIEFTYRDNTYRISLPTPKKAKKLMRMGKDIFKTIKKNENKIKECEEFGEDIPEDVQKEIDATFDFQLDFIVEAGIEMLINDDGKYSVVEKGYMEENFSNKLIQRIFRRINDGFAENEQEKKS